MKTFRCSNCGFQIQRPAQPFSCPQCGRQAVGLFKVVTGSGPAASGGVPPQSIPGSPYPPPGPPGPVRGGTSPLGAPPPPPGIPVPPRPASPTYLPPPAQPPAPSYVHPPAPSYAQPAPPNYAQPNYAPPTPPAYAPQPPQASVPPVQPVPPVSRVPRQPSPVSPSQPRVAQPPTARPQPKQAERATPPTVPAGPRPAVPGQSTSPATPPHSPPATPPQLAPAATPPQLAPAATPGRPGVRPGGRQSHRPRPESATAAAAAAAARANPPLRPQPKSTVAEPPAPPPRSRPTAMRPLLFAWAFPPEPPYDDQAKSMRNAPAVDAEGRIYLAHQGRLVALMVQGDSPQVVWEYVLGSHVPGPIVLAADGTLRAHCGDGFLHAVTSEGKQLWSPAHVGEPLGWAAPVVDAAGNTWVSAYDGGLIRVDAEGKMSPGRPFRSRQKLDSAGILHEGVLYVGSEEGYIFALALEEAKAVNLWNGAIEQGYTGGFVNSSPALTDDGILVVAARDEMLFGFALDGATAWSTRMPGQLLGSPVVDRHGHVYVGVSQAERGQPLRGFLVCVDGNSHKVRWQHEAAGPIESTPVIGDDDMLYFGDNSGKIHAIDDRGTAQWTAQVESAVRSAGTIVAPERVAFGLDDDTLVVLRCSSKGLSPAGWPKFGRTLGQTGPV